MRTNLREFFGQTKSKAENLTTEGHREKAENTEETNKKEDRKKELQAFGQSEGLARANLNHLNRNQKQKLAANERE